ncbi:SMI1/KNR4 family protein [uncultured Dokdonia sp.]|uniref:SMI1/KNR4 family protein n=1 Tax=uncultured Dokdonia sp. TaxID=575653 RepID=UPI002628FFF8|nr:SMI1/KNR4 family protein [uncultured Dokdonia sp.]
MIITFHIQADQLIIDTDLNDFEQQINKTLPNDYRQHMLQYNGGGIDKFNLAHVVDETYGAYGLAYLFALKYDSTTIESIFTAYQDDYPVGYIPIGVAAGGGEFIMSLNNDETYGEIKILEEDGIMEYLSPSFSQFLEDMVEIKG